MKHTPAGKQFTEIVLYVFKLNGLLIQEGDKLTRDQGLSSARWKVLGAVAHAEQAITVPQIARTMGQTRQAVQRIANEMAASGLIEFQINPQHKRAKLLSLTAEGKTIFACLEKKQAPWANASVHGIGQTELDLTLATLRKLINRFEPG